jgi:hypothetical protein
LAGRTQPVALGAWRRRSGRISLRFGTGFWASARAPLRTEAEHSPFIVTGGAAFAEIFSHDVSPHPRVMRSS